MLGKADLLIIAYGLPLRYIVVQEKQHGLLLIYV